MGKIKGIYQGFFVLSFVFFLVTSFLCVSSWNTENYMRNVSVGYAVEAIIFIMGIRLIKNGTAEILRETRSLKLLKELYSMILLLTGFGIIYSLIVSIFPIGMIYSEDDCKTDFLIYALNIAGVSLFFFIWMLIGIYKINKKLRYNS